ncbi:MAG: DUF447 family protein [Candidatus Bathyarchaeota archaeon]|nr:DUF447 family protein [Candidatus Bathyarchaeota archaeon]
MDRTEIPELLDELGFSWACIVETIVTTRRPDGSPSAAPMGITRCGADLLEIRPFKSSATYRNLLKNPGACVNVTSDPELFLATAFKREMQREITQPLIRRDLSLEAAEAAVFVEAMGSNDVSEDRGCFVCRAHSVDVRRNLPTVFSRGRAQAIEAIVHGTRIQEYLRRGRRADAEKLYKRFNECKEVVWRVSSPDSAEVRVIKTLETFIGRWRGEA